MSISKQIGSILTRAKSTNLSAKHDRIGRQFLNSFNPADIKHKLILIEAASKIKGYEYGRAYLSHWLHCPESYPLDAKPQHIFVSLLNKVGASLPNGSPSLKFIDLFCGIGGFHIALSQHGVHCVFASDIDEDAQATYYDNHHLWPFGNISDFIDAIPDHDILCAGFPCQPFSVAGRQLGFNDTRGTLFFDILTIVKKKKPRVLFLENVKNLVNHDGGRTFAVIKNLLEAEGYNVHHKVFNSKDFGIPQNRSRIFIVAFDKEVEFTFPEYNGPSRLVGDILEDAVSEDYTLSDRLWSGHQRRAAAHKAQHKGFKHSVCDATAAYTRTLTARYYKDGKEILIYQEGKNPRMLTPRECARLQGFPDSFKLAKYNSASYRQFGNSVTVPVVAAIAEKIIQALCPIQG